MTAHPEETNHEEVVAAEDGETGRGRVREWRPENRGGALPRLTAAESDAVREPRLERRKLSVPAHPAHCPLLLP